MGYACSSRLAKASRPWIYFLFIILVLLPGCGGKEEAATKEAPQKRLNTPPEVLTAEIIPKIAYANTPLTLRIKTYDKEDQQVTVNISWFVNRSPLPDVSGHRLEPGRFKKGDEVIAQVTPFDGEEEGETVETDPVVIKNIAPSLRSVWLTQEETPKGVIIRAHVRDDGTDPDGDPISHRFRWLVNDTPLEGRTGGRLEGLSFHKGDRVVAVVTPYDGEDEGEALRTPPLLIQNRAPKIISRPPEGLVATGVYRYQIKAVDPDGDPLRFYLRSAPEGMTIEPSTGLILWKFDPNRSGTYRVEIAVEDSDGAEAVQGYSFTLGRR